MNDMALWNSTPLVNLVTDGRISYGIVQPGQDIQNGVPIVRVKDIQAGIVDARSPLRVDPVIAQKHARTTLQGGELLLSLVGTVGEAAIASRDLRGWNVARAIAVIRPVGVTARWLRLCFASPPVRNALRRLLNTTVQATLNLSDLKTIGIPVPPRSVMDEITEVLGALDDKIAANAKLVEAADSLAKAMFASILPEAESMPLTKVARFVNGKAFTKGASGTGRVVVRIAELNSGIGGSTVYSDADVADQHLARPGDLLFAWSGSLTVCRWFHPEAIVNQHIFKVVPSSSYPIWCIYCLIAAKLDEFKAIAAGKATTMGHIQRRHLEEPVSVPTMAQVEHHDAAMTALWERALLAEQESVGLAGLRDVLLPQLMSGKIRVRDAEKTVEEVL